MNQKQQQVIDLYRESTKRFQDLLETKDYDYFAQDNFLTNVHHLTKTLSKFHEISVRGSEQWEYWFGLNEEEFREVIDHLRESK